ncbi:MAG: helix-turn-helix transcriptional regulator, partial [Streptosporangiaceae bacterium]
MSVGEALVEARIRAGLTTEEVSARSLIRESVIVAMERDDYEACGGPVYVNGYIRAVAAAIGVDPQPLVTEYARIQRAAQAAGPETDSAPEPEP